MDKTLIMDSLQYSFLDKHNHNKGSFSPRLIMNKPDEGQTVLVNIQNELLKSLSFKISVAFVTQAGIGMLKSQLLDLAYKGVKGKILISPYLGFNDPLAMKELLKLKNVEIRIATPSSNLHAKCYIFDQGREKSIIIGSSNLTDKALKVNYEWNVRLSSLENGKLIEETEIEFDSIWRDSSTLDEKIIDNYAKLRKTNLKFNDFNNLETNSVISSATVTPNKMQKSALASIKQIRREGARRALVVSATGTGKTFLSAFDVRQFSPRKMLFVVHREQILSKAKKDYQRILECDEAELCVYKSGMDISDKKYVFATIQTLSKDENLKSLNKEAFDYILIDEAHRTGAAQYLKIIDYFEPQFLLGMTATPERTDNFNIFELFDYNLAYEIRLKEALESDMLCPFLYFGVTDSIKAGKLVDDHTNFKELVSKDRVDHIIEKITYYGHSGSQVKGLIFCSSKKEAIELSLELNQRGYKTQPLTGEDSQTKRDEAVRKLENNKLDYLLTVDIFNEGIDIPSVNQVVMLRHTESSIVFVQQLGRGLRKHPDKEFVTVIDFIGNYKNNYLIPIALFGDYSMNKNNYREKLVSKQQLTGVSTINFEAIAEKEIFKSIRKTNFSTMVRLKESYFDLKQRLGRIPMLYDYILYNSIDPVVFFQGNFNHYGQVVNKFEKREIFQLTDYENKALTFFSKELLEGKRIYEPLLLSEIFSGKEDYSVNDFKLKMDSGNIKINEEILDYSMNVLDMTFFVKDDKIKYGGSLLKEDDGQYTVTDRLRTSLGHTDFKTLSKDVFETSVLRGRRYLVDGETGKLKLGEKYTRKDACKLLGWPTDEKGTVNGYKEKNGTCPIFVTLSKSEYISETIKYDDRLLSDKVLHWFTRSPRTFKSKEIKKLICSKEKGIDLHLFLQRYKGTEFYYVGPVTYIEGSAREETMNNKGKQVPVVSMDLALENSLPFNLYQYFTDYIDDILQ